ncbi:MAG TPA: hypothetical protein VFZ04_17075, partial [Longimicrobiales bacterium]
MSTPQTQRSGAFNWIVGKYGDLIPLLAFLAVVAFVYFYDSEKSGELNEERTERYNAVERRGAFLADQLTSAISQRQGAMATGELQFTAVEDSVSQGTLRAVFDTVTKRYQGLTAMSAVYPSGRLSRGANALLGTPGMQLRIDTAVTRAFDRAQQTLAPTASSIINVGSTRRFVIFDPVVRNNRLLGYLAAELDPGLIYRTVFQQDDVQDSLASGTALQHAVYGPNRGLISGPLTAPRDWQTFSRAIKVVDTEWSLQLAYPPVDVRVYRTERMMRWAIGLLIAFFTAAFFALLRRTITRQREELALRQVAEEAARTSAAEARDRAHEARELASQLEAAQHASQR